MSTVTQFEETHPELSRRRSMSSEMEEGLNRQLKAEMESSYIYLGMATYFEGLDLSGFASWFRAQAKEELEHAMKVYDFLVDRGAEVHLPALETPKSEYSSALEAFQTGLAQEQEISLLIQELYGLSQQTSEYDAGAFLHWFLQEQVEEENLLGSYVTKLKLGADSLGLTLLMLDKELGSR